MLEVGHIHTLFIEEINDRGALLRFGEAMALLPRRELPRDANVGQSLAVFVYHGRQDRLVATLTPPLAQVGEFALMRVSQANQYGAFLDWGLDKELLVPFAEQPEPMKQDRHYIVRVCIDNTGRLIGSAKIDRYLEFATIELNVGDEVDALIWKFTDLGVKAIINQRYSGLLYKDDLPPGIERGQHLSAYVKRIRDDHGIDLCLHKVGKAGVDEAKEKVWALLQQQPALALTDKSSPEQIEALLAMSKKAFKRAIGGLYKEGKIVLDEHEIRRK